MKLLCLDTSTKNFSLAVSSEGKVLASQDVFLKNVLSDSIVPNITAILKKSKIKVHDLDGFAIGLGPGSFTSLRVGLSTIKALSLALEKPVVGISTLDVLAMNVKDRDRPICTLNDARRGMVYACLYEWKKDVLTKKTDYRLIEIKDWLNQVPQKTMFIGDGIELYKKDIEKKVKGVVFAGEKLMYPQAKFMTELVLPRFKSKKFDDINTLVPIYLYPEDCQVTR